MEGEKENMYVFSVWQLVNRQLLKTEARRKGKEETGYIMEKWMGKWKC